jgi:hypothetical protein
MAWATVSRSLLLYIQNKSYVTITAFVDDVIGVSSSVHAELDHNIILVSNAIIKYLNYPDIVIPTKRAPSCMNTDVTGCSINLMLSPSAKAI